MPTSTPPYPKRGFTMIEMMVVAVIMIIVTAIVIGNLPSFRDQKSLELVAQEVMTIARQVQVYGTARRYSADPDVVDDPYATYGVHVRTTSSLPPSLRDRIVVYANDPSSSLNYQASRDARIEEYRLPSSIQMSSCVFRGATQSCDSNSGISAVYQSPYLQPTIISTGGASSPWDSAVITLRSVRDGRIRRITIGSSGLISIGP